MGVAVYGFSVDKEGLNQVVCGGQVVNGYKNPENFRKEITTFMDSDTYED
jgi:hypothetical protein